MIHSFVFSEGKLVGRDLGMEALKQVHSEKGRLLWVDLHQPTDEEWKSVLQDLFHFHPAAIEDCLTPSSLPKMEDYDEYLFLVAHGVDFTRLEKFNTTDLELFLGKDFLVTFHRTHLKSVQEAMDRCIKATGVVARGPDRLAHLILDLIVDNYKPAVDKLAGELDEIEETVLSSNSESALVPRLLAVKSEVARLRQIIRPQRELVNRLAHGDSKFIRGLMLPYFRDLRDNLIHIDNAAAAFADQLLISFDLYLSKSDFEANEGIKALTALTALTLPATLIATWYGMNFTNMPELQSRYGYPVATVVTFALTYIMWRWCKRRRWI